MTSKRCLHYESEDFVQIKRHLKILGARNVTCSKFYTEDPEFWGDPCISLCLALSALSM
jgi:hypothetical protein